MPYSTIIFPDGPSASRPVRITLTAGQTTVNPPFGMGSDPSLFGARPGPVPVREESGEVTPETAPEALDYAVEDIIDRDSDGYGFPPEEDYDPEADDGGEEPDPAAIWEALGDMLRALGEPDEEDSSVLETLGVMEKRKLPGGYTELTIRYEEADSPEPAETVVTLSSRDPDLVTISRMGPVTSMIVCEEGVRHMTAYRTPFGTLELAVLARRCESTVSFSRGGLISLDYLVEFHGTDLQYTRLRMQIEPADLPAGS
ncbi:MAG: DUF1934 domain-containing protein [Clostridia bacterium]|nr:DUF1934 domain-containing protein [Clostridia bacterium]